MVRAAAAPTTAWLIIIVALLTCQSKAGGAVLGSAVDAPQLREAEDDAPSSTQPVLNEAPRNTNGNQAGAGASHQAITKPARLTRRRLSQAAPDGGQNDNLHWDNEWHDPTGVRAAPATPSRPGPRPRVQYSTSHSTCETAVVPWLPDNAPKLWEDASGNVSTVGRCKLTLA